MLELTGRQAYTGSMNMHHPNARSAVSGMSLGQEISLSIIDGLGALLGITAIVLLDIRSAQLRSILATVSFSIYGSSAVFYFIASTLYHALAADEAKRVFRVFSHAGAYFMIAGTATPIMLIAVGGAWGWALVAVFWAFSVVGIVFSSLFLGKLRGLFFGLYFLIACLFVVSFNPVSTSLTRNAAAWFASGIAAFLVSGFFRTTEKVPGNQVIGHCFGICGSVLHFIGMLALV